MDKPLAPALDRRVALGALLSAGALLAAPRAASPSTSLEAEHREFLRVLSAFRAAEARLAAAYKRYVEPTPPLWRVGDGCGYEIRRDADGRKRAYRCTSEDTMDRLRAVIAAGESAIGDNREARFQTLFAREAKSILASIEQFRAERERRWETSGVTAAEDEADRIETDLVDRGLAILDAEPQSLADLAIQASVSISYGFGHHRRRQVLLKLVDLAQVPCLAEAT